MSSQPTAITAEARFAAARYRGVRVPNQYSVLDPAELRNLGETHAIEVRNARLLDPAPTIATHGFQIVTAPTTVDLFDVAAVKADFFAECRTVLKHVTDCFEVRGGSFEYRNGFAGVTGERGVKLTPNGSGGGYAMGIHSDMCAAVEGAFKRIVPDNRHFQSLNLWRSADPHHHIEMMPLALCDMGSVDPRDIVFGDGMNTGNIEQYTKVVDQKIVYADTQTWYYFPNMSPDEMLLFRQYDTREEALNRRTVFHTAVVDPTTRDDAPMRSTIEVRMQTVFEEETEKRARVDRFMSEISDHYRDGRKCDWWRGPIENYVPPKRS